MRRIRFMLALLFAVIMTCGVLNGFVSSMFTSAGAAVLGLVLLLIIYDYAQLARGAMRQ